MCLIEPIEAEGTHGKQSKERPYFKGSEWDKRIKDTSRR